MVEHAILTWVLVNARIHTLATTVQNNLVFRHVFLIIQSHVMKIPENAFANKDILEISVNLKIVHQLVSIMEHAIIILEYVIVLHLFRDLIVKLSIALIANRVIATEQLENVFADQIM